MKALIEKRTLASVIIVVLILMSLIVPVATAATPPPLDLPSQPVTVDSYGSYLLEPGGWPGAFRIVFSGIGSGFDVASGVPYVGWCLEDAHLVNASTVTLYSSYASNLPANLARYTDPNIPAVQQNPALLNQPIPWDKLNYLLNHKPGGADADTIRANTQAAVKLLIYGVSTNPVVTAEAQAAVNEANANGSGFVPAPGQIIAVIMDQGGIDSNTDNFQDVVLELTVPPYYDLGDLPAQYPTLNINNGPSHLVGPNLFLGACVEAELDGQPDANAVGDDNNLSVPTYGTCAVPGLDDEDGVIRTPGINWSSSGGGSVNVTVGSGAGCLSAWIDWGNDGSLTDAGDNILNNVLLGAGTTTRAFTIPAGQVVSGTYYARFRLYPTDEGNVCTTARTPTGQAPGGEVEDYLWPFGPNALTLSSISATSTTSPLALVLGLVAVMGVLLGGVMLARRPA